MANLVKMRSSDNLLDLFPLRCMFLVIVKLLFVFRYKNLGLYNKKYGLDTSAVSSWACCGHCRPRLVSLPAKIFHQGGVDLIDYCLIETVRGLMLKARGAYPIKRFYAYFMSKFAYINHKLEHLFRY